MGPKETSLSEVIFFPLKYFVSKFLSSFFLCSFFFSFSPPNSLFPFFFPKPWVQPLNKTLLKVPTWYLKELQFICADFFPFNLSFSKLLYFFLCTDSYTVISDFTWAFSWKQKSYMWRVFFPCENTCQGNLSCSSPKERSFLQRDLNLHFQTTHKHPASNSRGISQL